jgi:hypothetical protein
MRASILTDGAHPHWYVDTVIGTSEPDVNELRRVIDIVAAASMLILFATLVVLIAGM